MYRNHRKMLNMLHVNVKWCIAKMGRSQIPPFNIQFSPLHCLLTLKPSLPLYVVVNK